MPRFTARLARLNEALYARSDAGARPLLVSVGPGDVGRLQAGDAATCACLGLDPVDVDAERVAAWPSIAPLAYVPTPARSGAQTITVCGITIDF